MSASCDSRSSARPPLIAVVAGPTATILNQDIPVTSFQARKEHQLPSAHDWFGFPIACDSLHFQRLAAPVTVYIEMHSAHPLECEASSHYAPPDGYLDTANHFSKERRSPSDRPVYVAILRPEDGPYLLPYQARRADGSAWERHSPPTGPDCSVRQTFWPDARSLVEEIERTASHLNGNLSARAQFSYHRAAPSAGPAIEKAGRDYFPYGYHEFFPPRSKLAEITNLVQKALAEPGVRGLLWLEGSPRITETLYWLQLLIDTNRPIVGVAAQRPNHRLGADGPQQFVDAVDYILSDAWMDDSGRDSAGAVLVSDQRVLASREAAKAAGRPGGFTNLGGHGGVLGSVNGLPLGFLPTRRHGETSSLRLSVLSDTITGFNGTLSIKDAHGRLVTATIPYVEIVALPGWFTHASGADNAVAAQICDAVNRVRREAPLGGLVAEGVTGGHFEETEAAALDRAAAHGLPVVKVGRDAPESFVPAATHRLWIGGGNLTAAKARVLLMACLLRFGTLPAAADPAAPTPAERAAIRARLAEFQAVFDTH